MDLLGRVERAIRKQALLEPGQALVVGVSGGPDSLCLLDCLHRLDYRCVVAHLDHGLRPESRQQAEQVGRWADAWGLPFETRRIELAGSPGSLEEAARAARYQFLASVAHSHRVDAIAVGHTADDQAETVLMHLLRGAGPEGLRGMLPATSLGEWVGVDEGAGLRLVRPLLDCTHQQAIQHCTQRGLEPLADQSNLDPQFYRNRLRHELIPELERYNPQIQQALARTAAVMAGQVELVDQLVEAGWPSWVRRAGPEALALQCASLRRAPLAVQRAVFRRAVLELRPRLRDIGFEAVERMVGSLEGEDRRRQTVVGGLDLVPLAEEVVLRSPGARIGFPDLPQLQQGQPSELPVPGELELANGWTLLAAAAVGPSGDFSSSGPSLSADAELATSLNVGLRSGPKLSADGEPAPSLSAGARPALGSGAYSELASRMKGAVRLDLSGASQALTVRPPKPGDRLEPLGMDGTVKLSDLFVNRKVPWPARERWPVVCAGAEVVWVAGLHTSRSAVSTADSPPTVRLQLCPPAPDG